MVNEGVNADDGREGGHPDHHRAKANPALDMYGPAYARSWQYWKALLYSSCFQGLVLGAVALAFVNYYTAVLEATWKTGSYEAALASASSRGNPFNLTTTSRSNEGGAETSGDASLKVQSLLLGNGEWWYLFMLMGAGLCVGIVKCLWTHLVPDHPFPDKIPGFIQEVSDLQADDVLLPIPILLASGLSIGLGASVGPEAGLGAAGAAFGTLLRRRWRIGPYVAVPRVDRSTRPEEENSPAAPPTGATEVTQTLEPPPPTTSSSSSYVSGLLGVVLPDFENDRLCAIDGMAASFAGLFPSQFLSPLLIHEIGNHWGPGGQFAITETVARSGVAATVSYAFYVTVKGYTILPTIQLPIGFYDVIGEFQLIWVAYGMLLGVVSGVVGFLGFLSLAVFNVLGAKVTAKLNALGDRCGWSGGFLGKLLTPLIGGVLAGSLAIAAPLSLGDGSEQLTTVLAHGNQLGVGTLIVTAVLKLASVGICLGFGFVGGPFFPVIFTGACTGSIMHLLFPDIPLLISFSCCLVGVPAAILPGMFFLTTTASTCFVLGGPATAVVFFTCLLSYSTVCGMGLVQNLLLHAARKQELQENGPVDTDKTDSAPSWNPLLQKAWVERPLRSLSSIMGSRTRPDATSSTNQVYDAPEMTPPDDDTQRLRAQQRSHPENP